MGLFAFVVREDTGNLEDFQFELTVFNQHMATEFNSNTTIAEGEQYIIDGLNIWAYDWTDTKERISIQALNVPVYEIKKDDVTVRFAAVEQSNNVWCIYHKY